jgi:hypothetical protein
MKNIAKYAFTLAGAIVGAGLSYYLYGSELSYNNSNITIISNLLPSIMLTGTSSFIGREIGKRLTFR